MLANKLAFEERRYLTDWYPVEIHYFLAGADLCIRSMRLRSVNELAIELRKFVKVGKYEHVKLLLSTNLFQQLKSV